MVTTDRDSDKVLEGLIEALTITPRTFMSSMTADFKLILFQNHAISQDGMTELMAR